MKIHLERLKLNYKDGTAKLAGGMIYDLNNESQTKHYLEDMLKLEEGYIYQFSVEKDGE